MSNRRRDQAALQLVSRTRRAAIGIAVGASLLTAVTGLTVPSALAGIAPRTPAYGGTFGSAVAVAGSTAVVGAWNAANHRGLAYVFVKKGASWHQQAKLTDPGGRKWDAFGGAAAVESSKAGTYALIAAGGVKRYAGAAYVFKRTGSSWRRQATMADPDSRPYSGVNFGDSVALAGSTAVIGASEALSTPGVAYVYARYGSRWRRQATLHARASDPNRNGFGSSVAAAGDTVVVGEGNGTVYIFARRGGRWHVQAEETCRCKANGPNFGTSVSISGDTVLVGASGAPNSSGRGETYIFVRSGSAWHRQVILTDPNRKDGDNFGYAVGVSGSRALVGAPYANLCGTAYVYARSGSKWRKLTQLVQPGPTKCTSLDLFAATVAISGKNAAIGAPYESEAFLVSVP